MLSNILVATDGSHTAKGAVDFAAELAAKLHVPLTIGHVLQHGAATEELCRMAEVEHLVHHIAKQPQLQFANVPSNMDAVFTGTLSLAERERIIMVMGEEIVARAAGRAEDQGAQNISTRIGEGDSAEGIIEMASDVGADLIVIGRRGLGRVQRLFDGSVSQKVNQRAECTVAIVR